MKQNHEITTRLRDLSIDELDELQCAITHFAKDLAHQATGRHLTLARLLVEVLETRHQKTEK